jgi:CBS domain containing-hemolysin-like protein
MKGEHSRFPVAGEWPGEIIGIVRQDRILQKAQEGERNYRLGDIAEPAVTVREHDTLEEAATLMRQEMSKMALVTDAQGRYLGVLSVGGLLKHLFGSGLADIA